MGFREHTLILFKGKLFKVITACSSESTICESGCFSLARSDAALQHSVRSAPNGKLTLGMLISV